MFLSLYFTFVLFLAHLVFLSLTVEFHPGGAHDAGGLRSMQVCYSTPSSCMLSVRTHARRSFHVFLGSWLIVHHTSLKADPELETSEMFQNPS